MEAPGRFARARRFVRRFERPALVLYVAAVVAAVALVACAPLRDPLLDRVERGLLWASYRNTVPVERAERLLADGRYEDALAAFDALARVHPATHIKHGLSVERTRILRGIAMSAAALDKKGSALRAARALVAFDSRNLRSHWLLARLALDLGEPDEAREVLAGALELYPAHEDMTSAWIGLHAEAGDFASVTVAYERFLDAYRSFPVRLVADGQEPQTLWLPLDGRWHAATVWLESPVDELPALGDVHVTVESELRPQRVRRAGRLPERDAPIDRVEVRARLFKPVSAETWAAVERAYRNQLNWDGLAAARSRTDPRVLR